MIFFLLTTQKIRIYEKCIFLMSVIVYKLTLKGFEENECHSMLFDNFPICKEPV
jgi:hypothetical protein